MSPRLWLSLFLLTGCTASSGPPDAYFAYAEDLGHQARPVVCDPEAAAPCASGRRCAYGHPDTGDFVDQWSFACIGATRTIAEGQRCQYLPYTIDWASVDPQTYPRFETSECAAGLICSSIDGAP